MSQDISLNSNSFKTLKEPAPAHGVISDVTWRKTPGGKEIATLYSPTLRRRSYRLWLVCDGSPDDLTTWDSFISGLTDMSEPFTLIDHKNDTITVRFLSEPQLQEDDIGDVLIDIEMIEVRT